MDFKDRSDITLLDILIDGFEKNEVMDGHWRQLPMPDEASAIRKFGALVEEATRWKGEPVRRDDTNKRRLAGWEDIDIRQTGLAIHVRVKTPWFNAWWHDADEWDDPSFDDLYAWLREDRKGPAQSLP